MRLHIVSARARWRQRLARSLALCVLAGIAQVASAQSVDKALTAACEDEALSAKRRIAACSSILAKPGLPAEVRADALVNRGSARDGEGEHAKAVADFNDALKLSPGDPATLILRGNAYDALGKKTEALADYTEAIRINPRDASGYFNRATIYEEVGRNAEAITDYKKALEIDPTYEAAKVGLAGLEKKSK